MLVLQYIKEKLIWPESLHMDLLLNPNIANVSTANVNVSRTDIIQCYVHFERHPKPL